MRVNQKKNFNKLRATRHVAASQIKNVNEGKENSF